MITKCVTYGVMLIGGALAATNVSASSVWLLCQFNRTISHGGGPFQQFDTVSSFYYIDYGANRAIAYDDVAQKENGQFSVTLTGSLLNLKSISFEGESISINRSTGQAHDSVIVGEFDTEGIGSCAKSDSPKPRPNKF
jgi:hypothetical protein